MKSYQSLWENNITHWLLAGQQEGYLLAEIDTRSFCSCLVSSLLELAIIDSSREQLRTFAVTSIRGLVTARGGEWLESQDGQKLAEIQL